MPGIQKRDQIPPIRAFFDSTKNVAPLRNTVQHLDTDIGKTVDDQNWAVLGSLSWGVIYPERNEVKSCTFLPGMPVGSRPLINPLNRESMASARRLRYHRTQRRYVVLERCDAESRSVSYRN